MKSLLRAVFATLLTLATPAAAIAQDSSYIKVPNEDQEMNEAKDKARASLSHFWQKFGDPGANETGFAIKVALPYGRNSTEHIWTKDIERKDGKISAVINNEPRDVKTVRFGQRIEVSEAQISDWMYMRAGKIVGNYTMRPLLKRMPPQDAARYRAMLADP
ncbi:MAG TPA: DUF2314 domain-containing protein [Hyphomicrobiaceae bacterium]|nr:DUF2314 domain-containing protein [Hyphomicrobiaceae bacterium]HEX2336089.1 DUF2314 domain-containing protein [Hyphomicrobiaceae bacterium]